MDKYIFENWVWALPSIVFVIILIFFRKSFYLLIASIIHGRFSQGYVNLYRKLMLSHPFPQSIKDDVINHILEFFQADLKRKEYETSEIIEFLSFKYGSSPKKLLRVKKRPDSFYVSSVHGHEIKIIGYIENLFGGEAKALFYFINDKFFMGEYNFAEINSINPALISKLICEKYKIASTVKDQDFIINSTQGARLSYINTGFSLMIRYFNINEPIVANNVNEIVKSFIESFKKSSESDAVSNWIKYL